MHYIYWGRDCSRWVDFIKENVLVSFHSLKTMDLGPCGASVHSFQGMELYLDFFLYLSKSLITEPPLLHLSCLIYLYCQNHG